MVRSPNDRRKVEPADLEEVNSSGAEMDKEELLLLLKAAEVDVDPEPPMSIEQLEYDEDISAWIATVRSWLEATGLGQAELMEVIQGTAMSPVRVWMALLLGGFRLESQGDFYEGAVLVG